MLSVIMQSVVMLSVVMLSHCAAFYQYPGPHLAAPTKQLLTTAKMPML
jgi:hypothetical protein